ncbi:MAG TPA: alpha-glucan family phosphorylase, partial [Gaiellaceae bacterium]|nr:alpha-glucan family phosphorylase [Gaiellaceae bacterium]
MAEVHDGATLRAALLEIASDFSFTWIAETRLLFDALEPRRFADLHHNPTALLSELTDDDLAQALTPDYLERLARVQGRLARDRGEETWWRSRNGAEDLLVAYFSAEFGLDESLPIYSGGLGVLAGDYLKAASELGIPLVGIGLFYRRGYFRQQLDEHDRQVERYPRNDPSRLPLELVPMAPVIELADDNGDLVPVRLGVWHVRVGRVSLYLLDTKIEGNPTWSRDVTDILYGGDRENRLRQELLLGIGGVRVLRRLGLEPTVFHLNEGHSAFLQLERMRELVEEQGLSAGEALERLRASTVFTTHTPVPAGNEVFDPELVRRNLEGRVERCGLSWDDFLALGKVEPSESRFGLTPFALRTSQYANAVSELHG